MTRFDQLQWVVQNNLTGDHVLEDIQAACKQLGTNFVAADIPFSDELPRFSRDKQSIFYGSTTFIDLLCKDETVRHGVFYDPQVFSMQNYMQRWGVHMLNYGAFMGRFEDFIHRNIPDDKVFFIRPDGDDKSFNGDTMNFGEIRKWYENVVHSGTAAVKPATRILAGTPYNIQYEWRLWIVEGEVIAASRYREYFRLAKQRGCPMDVAGFAIERCREYTPHDVFVMDIALCGDTFYIVECGCMNGAGFYDADVHAIIHAVTAYFFRRYAAKQAGL